MTEIIAKVYIIDGKTSKFYNKTNHHLQDAVNKINIRPKSAIKKCLFGTSNPQDTDRMLKEQAENDRQRFLQRFGFDIMDIENLENCEQNVMKISESGFKCVKNCDVKKPGGSIQGAKTINRRKRKILVKVPNQGKNTHLISKYFKVRKISKDKEGNSSKQN